MSKYYTRKILETKIKKDMPNEFRDVILDLLDHLVILQIDVDKYIEKINFAEFHIINGTSFSYEILNNGKKEIRTINKKGISGFYKPIINLDKENNRYYIEKEFVVVNANTNEDIRGKIIHEVLHLLSSKNEILKEKNEDIHYSGFCLYKYMNIESEISSEYRKSDVSLNESITEVLRYFLMDEIYNVPYKISTKNKDGKITYMLNAYYIMTNIMQIISKVIFKGNIEELLKLYLNNSYEEFIYYIENKIDIEENLLKNMLLIFNNAMLTVCNADKNVNEIVLYLKKTIYPLYEYILNRIYLSVQKNADEDTIVFLNDLDLYIEEILSFPIINIMKNNLLKSIETYRYIF